MAPAGADLVAGERLAPVRVAREPEVGVSEERRAVRVVTPVVPEAGPEAVPEAEAEG
jgi:hypothetical protein